MSTRQKSICTMIGAVFLLFAVYLMVRPKEHTLEYDFSFPIKVKVAGPMVHTSLVLGSRSFGFYSYQKGAHLIGDDSILLSVKVARSALCAEHQDKSGRKTLSLSSNGASHAFTLMDLGGWRVGVPVGLHVLVGVMGILLMGLPLVAEIARRHSMRRVAQHVANANHP